MLLSRTCVAKTAFLAIALTPLAAQALTTGPGFANFEPSQTSPVRLSPDGSRLFAVNTPNASLSVFDLSQPANPRLLAEIPVGLGPVSVNPRSNDEVWVVNQVSNSVSVVSVSKGITTDTINIKTEPMDVVFAGTNQAYVSSSRGNSIVVLNATTHSLVSTIPLYGNTPRALAVSPNNQTVYAAFAISGNGTTIIQDAKAPPQCGTPGQAQCVPAINPQLPPPPQVPLIVAASDPNWAQVIKFKMPDNDVAIIKTGAIPALSGYYSGVGTINLGLAVSPVTGDLFVTNTDAINLTSFEPNLRGHWVNNRITRVQVATGSVTPFDLNPNINYKILPNPGAVATALAQPTSIVFDPSGSFVYIAAFGTDRVARVDIAGNVLSFVEVALPSGAGSNVDPGHKRGPRGLALNANTRNLYSLNSISNTISVINTSAQSVTTEIPVGTDPTPAAIKTGRGFLYDAKLSGNGTGSCASCHVDGDMDHLAWNLGDPTGNMITVTNNGQTIQLHPMKGPMATQTLRGLSNLAPFHWRGDKPNFQAFNASFSSLMGGAQLSSSDMNSYANFANSILFLPNPNQNLDRSLPTSLAGGNPVSGQNDFMTKPLTGANANTCNNCHTANPGPGSNGVINAVGFAQPLKTPELRNIYQKLLFTNKLTDTSVDGFGLNHDGGTSQLKDFFAGAPFARYTDTMKLDLAAYVICFDTGTAPAVGYTRTVTAVNVATSGVQADWSTLQSQAAAGNIDLIGRGTIQNQVHGLLYQPSNSKYLSDAGVQYSQAQLQTLIKAGDTLSFMGMYPGTGSPASQALRYPQ